jgi:phosphoglycerate dehydrogenase-like enzyme
MKILFAAPENAWGGFLEMLRSEVPQHDCCATGKFSIDSLNGVDVLIPTMCPVTEEILAEGDRIRLIQQCGAGLEGVDIEAARKRGIAVANVPTDISGNADSVAELGIYFMIGLARNNRQMTKNLRLGRMGQPKGKSLRNKTIGIVGLGGIGKALIKRLRPFGVRLMGIKRSAPEAAISDLKLDWAGGPEDLKTVLARSDFVVLCLPVTAENKNLINHDAFLSMKEGSFLINLSRGGLVDRDALEEALKAGMIAGAGLDVYWDEPPDPKDPIFSFNVLATPHIGGVTDLSMKGIVNAVAENIRRVQGNRRPLFLHPAFNTEDQRQ